VAGIASMLSAAIIVGIKLTSVAEAVLDLMASLTGHTIVSTAALSVASS